MSRIYKCKYCHKEIINEEPIEIMIGKTKYRAHNLCLKNNQEREIFFTNFAKTLGVPQLNAYTVKMLYKKAQNYCWEVFNHVLKIKCMAIVENRDKSINYHLAIIDRQLNESYKVIQKEKENKIAKEKAKQQINDLENKEIENIITKAHRQETVLIQCEDIADL